jgi:hypothetical protein
LAARDAPGDGALPPVPLHRGARRRRSSRTKKGYVVARVISCFVQPTLTTTTIAHTPYCFSTTRPLRVAGARPRSASVDLNRIVAASSLGEAALARLPNLPPQSPRFNLFRSAAFPAKGSSLATQTTSAQSLTNDNSDTNNTATTNNSSRGLADTGLPTMSPFAAPARQLPASLIGDSNLLAPTPINTVAAAPAAPHKPKAMLKVVRRRRGTVGSIDALGGDNDASSYDTALSSAAKPRTKKLTLTVDDETMRRWHTLCVAHGGRPSEVLHWLMALGEAATSDDATTTLDVVVDGANENDAAGNNVDSMDALLDDVVVDGDVGAQ